MPRKDQTGQLLHDVAAVLQKYGRPRKNPGGERPAAVTANGKTIPKVTKRHIPEIQHLSLPGAFRYVELTGPYGKTPTEKAKMAFYQAYTGQNGFTVGKVDLEIHQIDQNTSDSRLLLRSLHGAQKKLRKAVQ